MPEIDPLSHQKPGDIKNTNSEIVPFRDAVFVWLKIGLLSFGGPAGQIALMHRVLVEEEGWIEERRFLHALNFCMVLPGPEAQQLAIYIGWLMHGTRGGLVAGILFVLPGALVILLLSVLYAAYREFAIVTALFFGIKAAVLAVVIEALIRIGQKALRSEFLMAIAMLAFIGIAVFDVSFPFIILAAAVAGYVAGKVVPLWLAPREASSSLPKNAPTDRVRVKLTGEPAVGKTIRLSLTCLALWLLPTASLALWLGWQNVFVEEGIFLARWLSSPSVEPTPCLLTLRSRPSMYTSG